MWKINNTQSKIYIIVIIYPLSNPVHILNILTIVTYLYVQNSFVRVSKRLTFSHTLVFLNLWWPDLVWILSTLGRLSPFSWDLFSFYWQCFRERERNIVSVRWLKSRSGTVKVYLISLPLESLTLFTLWFPWIFYYFNVPTFQPRSGVLHVASNVFRKDRTDTYEKGSEINTYPNLLSKSL